ncbi:YhfX family PLP-dependent enzyme [Clostridium sp. YIM B02515]|uniref:YhfX family PLP-dependent enzyme n=1 Tax=Clostridium rhizosphaerae TaxID=2803861 RepID=A0ABS1T4Q4_9CLOT|nr:YhfX family PLP-dependent enzyme [Clostridium rhizosphaerae]MBL4934300.1 YhfX family PLP-dependent enzyme [Clostridium rhizosphaerae]
MFLDVTMRRNPNLMKAAFELHQEGKISPDTYVLDLDAIIINAKKIKSEADNYGVKLYFMTKQFGRNPYVANELMKLGYDGAVAVDFREAEALGEAGVKLGHVGHLVQIPSNRIEGILMKRPEVITVYSYEKARDISKAARRLGINQKLMLRVLDYNDILYPAQYGGFYLEILEQEAGRIMELPNIGIHGITSFPCFLYDEESRQIKETRNINTVLKAKDILEKKLSIKLGQVNLPSATCVSSIKEIAKFGGTHGEPGHGLLGTTPFHAAKDEEEIPAVVYVSEVSHNLDNHGYIYGGGHYRRSHMKEALIGSSFEASNKFTLSEMDSQSIDYYLTFNGNSKIGSTAVLAFRTQIFVTRSEVAVIKGVKAGKPELIGIYSSLGKSIRRDAKWAGL